MPQTIIPCSEKRRMV